MRVAADCPGYRDPLDLSFRNHVVKENVLGREIAHLSTTYDENGQQTEEFSHVGLAITRPSYESHLVGSILPPVGDLVTTLFFDYFAVEDITFGHAMISCLPHKIQITEDDALSAAVLSVGYALLFNVTKSSRNLSIGNQKYGEAVRLTRISLPNSARSETCRIVRVILQLAIFEVSSQNSTHLSFLRESSEYSLKPGIYF